MVDGTKNIALVLIITMSAVLLLLCQTSNVLAQQPLINNQSMNATSSIQGNATVANTTIDQAFDTLRDTFGSLFKK
jgi:anaerobic C4-dicarboxylate transporter